MKEAQEADFDLTDEKVARWSQLDPTRLADATQETLAREIVAVLLSSRRGNCLVCMPFADSFMAVYEGLVRPAISGAHLYPLRMDQEPIVGDIA